MKAKCAPQSGFFESFDQGAGGLPRFTRALPALYRGRTARHIGPMAVLDIARMGNPILRRRADPVPDPTAPAVRRLIADMLETMEFAGGTGLAAPQVHVPLRLVIFYVDGERAAEEDPAHPADHAVDHAADAANNGGGSLAENGGVPLTVLINPEIQVVDPTPLLGPEACLSLPGLAGDVPRATAVRYRGLGLDGAEILREASGFHARVVQHECDHLDGILYPQRMTDLSSLTFTSELERQARRAPPEV